MLIIKDEYNNEKVNSFVKKAKLELEDFFGFTWDTNFPSLVMVPDRKTIDSIKGCKTEDWVIGWADGKVLYCLQPENFEKESRHKYSDSFYSNLIKHELTHAFCRYYSSSTQPMWLFEGIAVHLSNQIYSRQFENPNYIDTILNETYTWNNSYNDSGLIVENLTTKFGKEKIIRLIKSTQDHKTFYDFKHSFKQIYDIAFSKNEIEKIIEE